MIIGFEPCSPPGVVLDTNSVLDWLVFRNPCMAALGAAVQARQVRWLACQRMRDELGHMLNHTSLSRWQPDARAAMRVFDGFADVLPPPAPAAHTQRLRCTDPDDQVFIDLAVVHAAHWLVTHDRALLKLARRARQHGVTVLRPGDWPPGAAEKA